MGKQWKQHRLLYCFGNLATISKILHPAPPELSLPLPRWNQRSVLGGYCFPSSLQGLRWGRPPPSAAPMILSSDGILESPGILGVFYYFDSLSFRVPLLPLSEKNLGSFKSHTGGLSDTFLPETFSSLGFLKSHILILLPAWLLRSLPAIRVSFSSSTSASNCQKA